MDSWTERARWLRLGCLVEHFVSTGDLELLF
jgi:hypothetical protein